MSRLQRTFEEWPWVELGFKFESERVIEERGIGRMSVTNFLKTS